MAEHDNAIPARTSILGLALAAIGACSLPAQSLEAGADADTETHGDASTSDEGGETTGDPNDPSDECLLGSQRDSVGQVSEYWSPNCPVVCEDENAWAHSDLPLDIAWTRSFADQAGPLVPGGMVRRASGDPLIVVSTADDRVLAYAVDAAGQIETETELDLPPTRARQVRMLGTRLYVLHDLVGGEVTRLTMFGDEGAYRIDDRAYAVNDEYAVHDFDVSALGVATLVGGWDGQTSVELLDHDFDVRWVEPGPDWALTLRMGSEPESAIVMASSTIEGSVVAWDEQASEIWNNQLLSHFVSTSDIAIRGERIIVSGVGIEDGRFDGRLAGIEPQDDSWNYSYGRAYSWCPDPEDTQDDVATAEFFNDLAILDDGTVLLAAVENYEGKGDVGRQPLVIRFAPDGQFLGRDRGLWQGYVRSVLAGPDELGFMLATDDDTGELILRAYDL